MHFIHHYEPIGFALYMSPFDFTLFILLTFTAFITITSLACIALYQSHQLSLLNLLLTSNTTTSPTNMAKCPSYTSYWSPKPHLPNLTYLHEKLYTLVDLICHINSYLIYCLAWILWAMKAVWFSIKSISVFLVSEITCFVDSLGFLSYQQQLASIGVLILTWIMYGGLITTLGLILLACVYTFLSPSPKQPTLELKHRFKNVTNKSKLGPGFLPATPMRPYTTSIAQMPKTPSMPPMFKKPPLPYIQHRPLLQHINERQQQQQQQTTLGPCVPVTPVPGLFHMPTPSPARFYVPRVIEPSSKFKQRSSFGEPKCMPRFV